MKIGETQSFVSVSTTSICPQDQRGYRGTLAVLYVTVCSPSLDWGFEPHSDWKPLTKMTAQEVTYTWGRGLLEVVMQKPPGPGLTYNHGAQLILLITFAYQATRHCSD